MLCFSNFASLAKSLKAQETLCIRMLYHRRVWLWLNCSSLAQWFELSCTGTLFCSVLPLMLLRCGTSIDFAVLPNRWAGWNSVTGEQLHRVTHVTFQTQRLLTLSRLDADIFWHLARWGQHPSRRPRGSFHCPSLSLQLVLAFSCCLFTESLSLVLVWMPPLSGHAASSIKSVVCVVLQVPRNLANNLIARHPHWAHSEQIFVVGCGAHRWQHAVYLQAVTLLVVLKTGCLHRLVFAEVCGFTEPFPK